MRKYGLRSQVGFNSPTNTDPEILIMINNAAQAKFSNMIRELINISRS